MKRSHFVILSALVSGGIPYALADDATPYPLGTSDLAGNIPLEAHKAETVWLMDFEAEFAQEAVKQLDLEYEVEAEAPAANELAQLKNENERLKARVSDLERRLAMVEAKLRSE